MSLGLYDRWILPRLTHLAMRSSVLDPYRSRALARARGEVLEIGMGSGLNLPFYGHDVRRVLGIEPSLPLVRLARGSARDVDFPVEVLVGSAEELPLPDASLDMAVTTWSLCTIPDPVRALREVRRVLRSDGQLIFVEHGRAPEAEVARWRDRLTPLWRRCAGGCHRADLAQIGCAKALEDTVRHHARPCGRRAPPLDLTNVGRPTLTVMMLRTVSWAQVNRRGEAPWQGHLQR